MKLTIDLRTASKLRMRGTHCPLRHMTSWVCAQLNVATTLFCIITLIIVTMFCLCPMDLTSVETCISNERNIEFPMSCVWRNPKPMSAVSGSCGHWGEGLGDSVE